jgi:hypothetical protein
LTSRTRPSMTAPRAPRAFAAVESRSPQGAVRAGGVPPVETTTTSPGRMLSIDSISISYGSGLT